MEDVGNFRFRVNDFQGAQRAWDKVHLCSKGDVSSGFSSTDSSSGGAGIEVDKGASERALPTVREGKRIRDSELEKVTETLF